MTSEAECPIPDVTYRPSTIGKSDTSSSPGVEGAAKRHDAEDDPSSAGQSGAEAKGNVGTAMGILIPFGLVILAVGWVFYAYRHPHTKSGQLLIQVRRFEMVFSFLKCVRILGIDAEEKWLTNESFLCSIPF